MMTADVTGVAVNATTMVAADIADIVVHTTMMMVTMKETMMMMIMDTQIPTLVFNLSTKDSVTVSARSFVSWPATISVFLML